MAMMMMNDRDRLSRDIIGVERFMADIKERVWSSLAFDLQV